LKQTRVSPRFRPTPAGISLSPLDGADCPQFQRVNCPQIMEIIVPTFSTGRSYTISSHYTNKSALGKI